MSEISMTDYQRHGKEVLRPEQITALKHKYKQGERLTNLEIEKLIQTAEFALDEMSHLLRNEVKPRGCG